MSDCSAGPPQVSKGLECSQSALASFDRLPEIAGGQVHLSQAGFCAGFDFVQTGSRSNRRGVVAVVDCNIRLAASHDVTPPAPVMPGGAVARLADLIYERPDLIEGLDIGGVLSQGKLAVALLD